MLPTDVPMHSPDADDVMLPPLAFVRVRRRGRRPWQPASEEALRLGHSPDSTRAVARDALERSGGSQPAYPRASRSPLSVASPRVPQKSLSSVHLIDSVKASTTPRTRGNILECSIGSSFAPLFSPSTPHYEGANGPKPTMVEFDSEASVPNELARSKNSNPSAPNSPVGECGNGHGGSAEAPTPPNPNRSNGTQVIEEEALLQQFHATLDDSRMLDPVINFDEDELLTSVLKRKGCPSIKLDNKIKKKISKSKGKLKLDDDIGDGLLNAILDPNVSPEEIELCYGPRRGRIKP